jgi:hypothetical protein
MAGVDDQWEGSAGVALVEFKEVGQGLALLEGFEKDDLALLARAGLLAPLGNPTANAVKYYATVDVAAFSEDRDRLDQATAIIYSRNRSKFAAQQLRAPESLGDVNG